MASFTPALFNHGKPVPRLLAVGDIHGNQQAFLALLKWLAPQRSDTLVTLGDYIARGPNSRGVIDTLLKLRGETNLVPLLGNHELLMLWATTNKSMYQHWLNKGGQSVLDSYGKRLKDVPESHWEFLNTCTRYYETGEHIFVHAIVDPTLPLEEQSDESLFWKKLTGPLRHYSGKLIVCGHTPQRSSLPLLVPGAVCIDTDVKRSGWLTALDLHTGGYYQTNAKGERRRGELPIVERGGKTTGLPPQQSPESAA